MEGDELVEQPAVIVVATPIEDEGGGSHTPPRAPSSRPRSSRTRTRRRRTRPASAAGGDRGSSTERERDRGNRRPSSAIVVGSPERVRDVPTGPPAVPETYTAWGTLENTLPNTEDGDDHSRPRSPVGTDTGEERSERSRRSNRRQRGRSARSTNRGRDNDSGQRERRQRGSRRERSARRRRARDNLDDDEELLEEDMHGGSEERKLADRPATAGTMRVPHMPADIRPSSGSVASFRSASARPTSRPSEMVGMPPNMDGRNWVQPNRPAAEKQIHRQQRQRSAQRLSSARSSRSFEQRSGTASTEAVRTAESVKPEPWLSAEVEGEEKPRWLSKAKAIQIAAAVTQSTERKVRVEQNRNSDGTVQTRKEAQRAQRKDSVEVFVHEHQRELVEYFESGYLQAQLPGTASLIRKALGIRAGARRLLALLCCATLALGVYAAYLSTQVEVAREELEDLKSGNGLNSGVGGGGDTTARSFLTTVKLSRGVIPHDQFARVCRCVHRPKQTVATHVVAFEAVVDHIYGDNRASFDGNSQLVAGISLYDASVPWSPTSPGSAGGESSGYCDPDDNPNHNEDHECTDQLGAGYGGTSKLLWQWSPERRGEGIPAHEAAFFRFPTEAGLRLEPGRPYSFVVQVDYDMGYFFGQHGSGAGHIEWQQWRPWDQSGVKLHETTALRPHDAAVLSFTQMDFELGSAIRLPGRTDQGLIVELPPLVKTEALWSVDEQNSILVPGSSATVFAFGGKTRSLGTAVELALWRTLTTLDGTTTYGRVARWIQALRGPWAEESWRPRVDKLVGMSGSGVYVASGDLLRLSCEYSVLRPTVRGGYGPLDETCSAMIFVYPATVLLRSQVARHHSVDASALPATAGQGWLTQHTMTYDTPLDATPVSGSVHGADAETLASHMEAAVTWKPGSITKGDALLANMVATSTSEQLL